MVYGTSALNGRRYRRTHTELAEINAAIYDIAAAEQPITVRGLFYRVMSRGLVPKSEKGYSVVQRQALKMRRNCELPYGWITDGSRLRLKPRTFTNAQAALENTAYMYRRDLWIDQGIHVEVWCEKDAIRGVVSPVTTKYDVPLMISRGFSSETFLYETAEDINAEGNRTVIYQLGDHDPSGVAAWEDIQRKLLHFVNGDLELTFQRIAVTPEQIVDLNLPTRPTKQSDTRAARFIGDSVEVDAIPSSTLRELVSEAIESWIDPEALRLTKIAEESEKEILYRIAGDWEDSDHARGWEQ
ncbi:hypothetical protein NGTWS0302_24010 [Mycolicibacterium cyprinidarum]|uniref:Uncharacterized protein n=1 Tax=Mycolicibacterium cyprinidarum TaxID=2860311 RepID=A0ABQ4V4L2_9MYCO|nr:hypothetical protein NGTWS0302_24010 [Mycolicibacterium sp. NGTWS0302]GJF10065.1 hypothetical protein NGTWS1702_34580 [Mycolicibacterium sp. NGTWSNA01]